jgi:glycine betaine/proline transport system substrate-binding protein
MVLFIGCGGGNGSEGPAEEKAARKETVRIVYVDWASERASAQVVKAVLEERMGRECRLLDVTLVAMWQALAAGDQDATVAAWLPSLQARFLKRHGSEVVNLGPNLKGTRIGLVVPDYVPVDSITELTRHTERFEGKIIGIDPHAGLMDKTKKAFDAYDLHDFELVSGSGPTMTTALGRAIRKREWIVVTGWTPHWKFARWDLKYLEDPRNVYGEEEHISTIVRKGLKEDMPRVYAFLDNFSWSPGDMAEVMYKAQANGTSYAEAAKEWVHANERRVSSWLEQ